ncbi:hypothetical protein NKG94_49285 [Micromonospora sp. M12]
MSSAFLRSCAALGLPGSRTSTPVTSRAWAWCRATSGRPAGFGVGQSPAGGRWSTRPDRADREHRGSGAARRRSGGGVRVVSDGVRTWWARGG